MVQLHGNILNDYVREDDIKRAAQLFGMVENNNIVLESPIEKDALMDFNVYERFNQGDSNLFAYINSRPDLTDDERIILKAMKTADTQLYEVVEIDKQKGILLLRNSISPDNTITLVDNGMSGSLHANTLLFTRLVHFDDFSMTSGLFFCFSKDHERYLIKRSRKLMKKINSGEESIDRFIAFFTLNRKDGLPAIFEEVN